MWSVRLVFWVDGRQRIVHLEFSPSSDRVRNSVMQLRFFPIGKGVSSASLKEKDRLMSRMSAFSSPFLLGFDEVERVLDRVAKGANEGYPPYNIERLDPTESKLLEGNGGSGDVLRITLAVAGFTRDQLDVTLEESQLVIRGRQVDDQSRQYLHRGIAARQFQRSFVLAEGIEILGAELKDGLLSIDLARPEPEKVVRKIAIDVKE